MLETGEGVRVAHTEVIRSAHAIGTRGHQNDIRPIIIDH
jgi:hypothetical protein